VSSQLGAIRLVTRTRAPGVEAVVAGGVQGLSRVLLNLVLNARDAAGERRTSSIWVETSAAGGEACLTVSDDGPGFSRTPEPLASDKLDGSGVGLSSVKAIVEASGGSLRFSANHPHGARVEVKLRAQLRRSTMPQSGMRPA
jgi:two-component system sensor histidine kinase TctE